MKDDFIYLIKNIYLSMFIVILSVATIVIAIAPFIIFLCYGMPCILFLYLLEPVVISILIMVIVYLSNFLDEPDEPDKREFDITWVIGGK